MDEKTQNKIMEALTGLYQRESHLKINDYYVYVGVTGVSMGVIAHFGTFGSGAHHYVREICDAFKCEWVIQNHLSVDGDIPVNFY